MASGHDLETCVSRAIIKIRQRVKKSRLTHQKKKHLVQDYPSIVVACGYQRSGDTFWGVSASPVNHHYNTMILERLISLGVKIGEKRKICKNAVGACAEPHAADKVVKSFPGCKMNELQFSRAYRPRTAQRKKNCKNCKDTFYEVL